MANVRPIAHTKYSLTSVCSYKMTHNWKSNTQISDLTKRLQNTNVFFVRIHTENYKKIIKLSARIVHDRLNTQKCSSFYLKIMQKRKEKTNSEQFLFCTTHHIAPHIERVFVGAPERKRKRVCEMKNSNGVKNAFMPLGRKDTFSLSAECNDRKFTVPHSDTLITRENEWSVFERVEVSSAYNKEFGTNCTFL